jgi:predicted DNA-binding mobile mystery protein A
MSKVERSALARRAVDAKFEGWQPGSLAERPAGGWIRAARDALGMTTRQLAGRLGVSQSAITQLEKSEVEDGIRLESLRRLADALDCDLHYALVPRGGSFEEIIQRRARQLAEADVALIAQRLRFEEGPLRPEEHAALVAEQAARLIAENRLWREPPPTRAAG